LLNYSILHQNINELQPLKIIFFLTAQEQPGTLEAGPTQHQPDTTDIPQPHVELQGPQAPESPLEVQMREVREMHQQRHTQQRLAEAEAEVH